LHFKNVNNNFELNPFDAFCEKIQLRLTHEELNFIVVIQYIAAAAICMCR